MSWSTTGEITVANYRYVIEKCKKFAPTGLILDYGCGSGEIVVIGRATGLNIFGVDIFYEGSSSRYVVESKKLLGNLIFQLNHDGKIPFDDNYFDLVVSNQVFEHVQDLDLVLREISRVLKPAGLLLALFPSRDVLREGHCGVPLVHWFPKDSYVRYFYMRAMRQMGFGYFKEGKSKSQWTTDFLKWLDQFTVYRSYEEIARLFSKNRFLIEHIEDDYIAFRLSLIGFKKIAFLMRFAFFSSLSRFLCRKLGGMVLLAKKVSHIE